MKDGFTKIWEKTNARIEAELRSRGESMLPGNPQFDAIAAQIQINRADRELWERAMSTPITHWNNSL